TAAGVPDPVPIIMQFFAHQRLDRGGTTPEIVINVRGNLLRAVDLANTWAPLVAKAANDLHFSETSLFNPFDRFLRSRLRTTLCAGLNDLAVFAGGFDDFATFPNVVRNRLFDVNVLACLDRPN